MALEDLKAKYHADVIAAEDQALDSFADAVALMQKASDGTLSQADVDKAVADQKVIDDADKAAAVGVVQTSLDQVTADLAATQAKLGADDTVLASLKASAQATQDALAALQALLNPIQPVT